MSNPISSSTNSVTIVAQSPHEGVKCKKATEDSEDAINTTVTNVTSAAFNNLNLAVTAAAVPAASTSSASLVTPPSIATESTALDLIDINLNPVRRFRDGTSPVSYKLFCDTVHQTLETYNSVTKHNFIPRISGLIAEFAADDDLTAPIPSDLQFVSQGREYVSSIGFGKKMWNDYFGDIGEAPPLPANICEILKSPCPFFPGKTIAQTHVLALVPATLVNINPNILGCDVNILTNFYKNKPMNVTVLASIVSKSIGTVLDDHCHGYVSASYKRKIKASHWILMTKAVPKETRGKSFKVQKGIIERSPGYQIPKLAQAVAAILLEYAATRIYLYATDNPNASGARNFTRTQEQEIMVGDFAGRGLFIWTNNNDCKDYIGAAALRRLGS